jgi:hypothetical protein
MGTRAIISFIDEDGTYHVYKHWDGDPKTIKGLIEESKTIAWDLPRFESNEFAAAFITTAKKGKGDVRLSHDGPDAYYDLSYSYEVRAKDGKLFVDAFDADGNAHEDEDEDGEE